MTIHKSSSWKPAPTTASGPQGPSAPAEPPPPKAPPPPKPPSPGTDTFASPSRPRSPPLDEGSLRRGPATDPRVREGTGGPVHRLLRSGHGGGDGPSLSLRAQRDVQEVNTPTPVGTLQATADPRTQPLPLNDLIRNPQQAQQVIDQYLNSGDPQLMRYGETLRRAVNNPTYQQWVSQPNPPSIVLTSSAGNGNEPVMLLVPPDFAANPSYPRPVQTYYHGVGLPVGGHPDAAGTTEAIDAIWKSTHPDPIFVLPEAQSVPDDPGGTHGGWRLNGTINVAQTTNDALAVAYAGTGVQPAISERVVSAHSRGGAALALSLQHDPNSLQADRLLLLDCLYQINVAPDVGGRELFEVEAVLAQWVDQRRRDGKPLPTMVFYQQDSADDGTLLGTAMRDTGRFEVQSRTDHMALNSEGLTRAYPSNQPGAGTPTPTPVLTPTPTPTP
jgi:hypothetical protein